MGDKSQGSSFKKGAPRTYTFRLCQNKISILYKKKNGMNKEFSKCFSIRRFWQNNWSHQ